MKPAAFVIKAAVPDLSATTFVFESQKTMYGGKQIGPGDQVFILASENEGGPGLIASGVVTSARAVAKDPERRRETPRVTVEIERTATAKQRLGRQELRRYAEWSDGRPETELNFKLYRQATNKIAGVSSAAAAFLRTFF